MLLFYDGALGLQGRCDVFALARDDAARKAQARNLRCSQLCWIAPLKNEFHDENNQKGYLLWYGCT